MSTFRSSAALLTALALASLGSAAPAASPEVTIGSASGAVGTPVSVDISLRANGAPISVIAPLQFDFDAARLAFGACVSAVPGKAATVNRNGNRVGVVLAGGEGVFPDGVVVRCTFAPLAGAQGNAPLTFIRAGLSDTQFNDLEAQGSDGAVTVVP